MRANTVEKMKGTGRSPTVKLPEPVEKQAVASTETINLPAVDLEAVHVIRYRQLLEESKAREQKLLAELEEKQEIYYKKIEESFAVREKLLAEDLHVKHMAEIRRLELASADREHTLLIQLGVARRRLSMLIVAAVLTIVAIVNFRSGPKDATQPVLPTSGVPGEFTALDPTAASFPALALPEVALATPSLRPVGEELSKTAPAAKKAGNGGNFARGISSGK